MNRLSAIVPSCTSNLTEQPSTYEHLEKMDTQAILEGMNLEDEGVALAVGKALPRIVPLINKVVEKLQNGGRLFYIGAGTSGRLGILDASECPPTFGVSPELVVGIIAGSKQAVFAAVENAEDDTVQGWLDLLHHSITNKDVVVGISASGSTPYVLAALDSCRMNSIETGCIVCNAHSPIALSATYPIEVLVGPEFLTGSTRLKSGTAQKMVLNMISTASMIRLGKVKGNKMIYMQLTNAKLRDRAVGMLTEMIPNCTPAQAKEWIALYGSIEKVLDAVMKPSNTYKTH